MSIEFFKKRERSLALGFGVSALLLLIALIIISNLEILMLVSLITLLSPTGFLFILIASLLLGSVLGSLLWVGTEYAIERIKRWHEHRRQSSLTEEDKCSTWLENRNLSDKSNSKNQDITWVSNSDIKNDALLSPEDDLTEFSKQADNVFDVLNNSIPSQEDINQLSESFRQFKQIYYMLAKKYHPDKGEKIKISSSTNYFQQLNSAYSKVKISVDSKLESLTKKSWKELMKEENKLLKDFLSILEKHQKWLNKVGEELDVIASKIGGVSVRIAHLDKGILGLNEGIQDLGKEIIFVKELHEIIRHAIKKLDGQQEADITDQAKTSSGDDKNRSKAISPFFG